VTIRQGKEVRKVKVVQRQESGGPDGGGIPFVSLSREDNERRIMELMVKAGAVDSAD
jgi:hypothetical protein